MGTWLLDSLENDYPADVFFTYANTDITNNPYGLIKTAEKIPNLPYESPTIKGAIDEMIEWQKRKWRRYIGTKSNCHCGVSKTRRRKKTLDTEGLTCHECDQQFFVYMLTQIINGCEFSAIEEFDHLLLFGGLCIEQGHTGIYRFSIERDRIKLNIWIPFGPEESEDESKDEVGPFSNFFMGAVAQSLLVFLTKNDRRRLKKCNHCGKFYPAKRLIEAQKYCPECSPKNKMSRKQRKLYQRHYRKRGQAKKERMRVARDEPQIQQMMKILGLTRAAAIEQMKIDKTL
jgi:hypothetical protein